MTNENCIAALTWLEGSWQAADNRSEAARAVKCIREQTAEIARLRNIVTGCPVCSELERNIQPANERDEYKVWWERDSTSLGKVLNEVSSLRAGKEQFRVQVQQLRAALKVARQALIETIHAQECGPSWYSRGESGMYAQVRMWTRRGTEEIDAALGPYDENGEYEKEKASHEPLPVASFLEQIKSWRNPYRTHYNDGFNYALNKVIELFEGASRDASSPCPSVHDHMWAEDGHCMRCYAQRPGPADLVGALQDVVHTDPGPVRAGKSVKSSGVQS